MSEKLGYKQNVVAVCVFNSLLFNTLSFILSEILYYVRKSIQPHCRPQVPPDSAPRPYIDLMKICWDESPERRPTFSGILKILKKINNGK